MEISVKKLEIKGEYGSVESLLSMRCYFTVTLEKDSRHEHKPSGKSIVSRAN